MASGLLGAWINPSAYANKASLWTDAAAIDEATIFSEEQDAVILVGAFTVVSESTKNRGGFGWIIF